VGSFSRDAGGGGGGGGGYASRTYAPGALTIGSSVGVGVATGGGGGTSFATGGSGGNGRVLVSWS
jgi:hypothetical protein